MTHGKKRFKIMEKRYVRWPPFSPLTTARAQTSSTPASAAQENRPPAETSGHPHSCQCNHGRNPVLQAQDGLEVEDGVFPAASPAKAISQPTSAPANGAEDANIDTEHGECLTPSGSPPNHDLPLDWNYVILKIQRLEIQQSRLIDMYKEERLKNYILRTKLSAFLGGWRTDCFHPALDDLAKDTFCENSDEPIPPYHIPEGIGKEVDDSMAELATAEDEMKREALRDFVTNAIEREKVCMSMIQLQTDALRAMQEGKIIDVENLMEIEGLRMPERGDNKAEEDGKTEVLN